MKTGYCHSLLPIIEGEERGVEIKLKGYPIRISETQPPKRIEYYTDFNVRLIDAIWDAIGDYPQFAQRALIAPVELTIVVKDAPVFFCEISLKSAKSQREFADEMLDAIIKAFKSADIRR